MSGEDEDAGEHVFNLYVYDLKGHSAKLDEPGDIDWQEAEQLLWIVMRNRVSRCCTGWSDGFTHVN